jgi:hypothetical protein
LIEHLSQFLKVFCLPLIGWSRELSTLLCFFVARTCSFLSKAINAEESGAKAVVVMDNNAANDETLIDMVDDGSNRVTHISAFFLLGKDGFVYCFSAHFIHTCVKNLSCKIELHFCRIQASLVCFGYLTVNIMKLLECLPIFLMIHGDKW